MLKMFAQISGELLINPREERNKFMTNIELNKAFEQAYTSLELQEFQTDTATWYRDEWLDKGESVAGKIEDLVSDEVGFDDDVANISLIFQILQENIPESLTGIATKSIREGRGSLNK